MRSEGYSSRSVGLSVCLSARVLALQATRCSHQGIIIMERSYVCANVGNVRGYRRYVDMYTSEYQRHSPTVGLHAEGLALQCLSFVH